MPATAQKRYEYKVSRNGTYLGLLQFVKSDFAYNQLINTAGAQLEIKAAVSVDAASLPVSPILDETGEIITDETGAPILEERPPEVIGDSADNILIRNDNVIDVWEFDSYNPNGKLVYSGYIAKIKAVFGGDDDITITCKSKAQDLAHYLTPGGTADTQDQANTTDGGDPAGDTGSWYINSSGVVGAGQRFGQSFTVGVGITNLSAIRVKIGQNPSIPVGQITMKIWNSVSDANAGVTPLATITKSIATSALVAEQVFQLATPITVVPGQGLFFGVEPDPASYFNDFNTWMGFSNSSSDVYAGGQMWRKSNGVNYVSFPTSPTEDWWFKTYYSHNTTTKTYLNSDPSTTLTALLDYYIAAGGSVSKQPGGYALTGFTPAETTFKVNTILEAIQKIYDLGPADWYWYVDPATNIFYYKQSASTATHRLIKGRHLDKLEIELSKEEIANIVYFSGGQVLTENLFVTVSDTPSLLSNRRGLVRLSDNKVTDTSVGQLIAQNYIDQHDEQNYITEVTIVDGTYDISLFNLGEMVAFGGFGNFVDNLLLQIVGINRTVDEITLSLGVLRPRATALSEQLRKEMIALQTVDNPDTPS